LPTIVDFITTHIEEPHLVDLEKIPELLVELQPHKLRPALLGTLGT
jgi:hypothetical protein